jgi:MFS family permease
VSTKPGGAGVRLDRIHLSCETLDIGTTGTVRRNLYGREIMAEISAGGMEFRTGSVIARSFSIFFRNIAPFGLIALVLTSPTYVYAILAGAPEPTEFSGFESAAGGGFAVIIVEFLLGYLVMAALVFGTIQDLRGSKVSVGECFSQGVARMFPVMGIAILAGILTGLATLAFVIPGIIVGIMLWVTIPVAVVERRGIGSLARSSELTKGYRWRIFFALIIMIVIFFGAGLVFGMITFGVLEAAGGTVGAITGILALDWIFSALISMFIAIVYAVSYHDLRVAKEGVDTDQIAAVFD